MQALRQDLDAGEAEAIALALETNADLLLMDERLGRATAQHLGLRYIGLIGVLITAKQRGLTVKIKPDLDRLRIENEITCPFAVLLLIRFRFGFGKLFASHS